MENLKFSPISLYDLLARIIPGFIFVIGLGWALEFSFEELLMSVGIPNSIGVYLVLLCASFVGGLFLSSVSGAVFEAILKIAAKVYRPLSEYCGEKYWIRLDKVGRREAGAGQTLAKIASEATMCESMMLGTIVVLTVSTRPIPWSAGISFLTLLFFVWGTRKVVLIHRIKSFEYALDFSSW